MKMALNVENILFLWAGYRRPLCSEVCLKKHKSTWKKKLFLLQCLASAFYEPSLTWYGKKKENI